MLSSLLSRQALGIALEQSSSPALPRRRTWACAGGGAVCFPGKAAASCFRAAISRMNSCGPCCHLYPICPAPRGAFTVNEGQGHLGGQGLPGAPDCCQQPQGGGVPTVPEATSGKWNRDEGVRSCCHQGETCLRWPECCPDPLRYRRKCILHMFRDTPLFPSHVGLGEVQSDAVCLASQGETQRERAGGRGMVCSTVPQVGSGGRSERGWGEDAGRAQGPSAGPGPFWTEAAATTTQVWAPRGEQESCHLALHPRRRSLGGGQSLCCFCEGRGGALAESTAPLDGALPPPPFKPSRCQQPYQCPRLIRGDGAETLSWAPMGSRGLVAARRMPPLGARRALPRVARLLLLLCLPGLPLPPGAASPCLEQCKCYLGTLLCQEPNTVRSLAQLRSLENFTDM